MSQDPRSEALSALARLLVAEVPVGETLHRLAETTMAAMPSADIAGMSMLGEDGKPSTRVYTDERSPEVDEAQYSTGVGPCLDAWREQRVVHIPDMNDALATYPEFARRSLDRGILSTLSFPMAAGGRGIGALNLYAKVVNGFSDDDVALGEELAAAASAVLANAAAYWEAADLSEGLKKAMESRAVIEQAKGMLMANTPGLDADGAYELLARASQRSNVKLREIARQIVERNASPGTA